MRGFGGEAGQGWAGSAVGPQQGHERMAADWLSSQTAASCMRWKRSAYQGEAVINISHPSPRDSENESINVLTEPVLTVPCDSSLASKGRAYCILLNVNN